METKNQCECLVDLPIGSEEECDFCYFGEHKEELTDSAAEDAREEQRPLM